MDIDARLQWGPPRNDRKKPLSKVAIAWRATAAEFETMISGHATIDDVFKHIKGKRGALQALSSQDKYTTKQDDRLVEVVGFLSVECSWPEAWLNRWEAIFYFDESLRLRSYLLSAPSMSGVKHKFLPLHLDVQEID